MHKKCGILLTAIAALLSFNQAYAQSSHDIITDVDHDLGDSSGDRFEITSPDGKFKMAFKGHVQQNNKYSHRAGTDQHDIDIDIHRARFTVLGNAIDPRLTYLFQLGLDGDAPTGRAPAYPYVSGGSHYLRDYYLNFSSDESYFQARIGKFRTPFSRQQLMSTSQMQFYDQSAANDEFQLTTTGRDVGIMFHNGWANAFEWAFAAVKNGLVLRLGVNHNDIDAYDMTDWGGDFRFGFAVNGFMHTDYKSLKLDDVRGGADFIVKVGGFSTNGSFFYQRRKNDEAAEARHNFGGGLDLGLLLGTDVKIEPVLRYSWIKMSGNASPHQHEILGGLNHYILGHHLKVQGYGGANLTNKDIQNWIGGVQFQLAI